MKVSVLVVIPALTMLALGAESVISGGNDSPEETSHSRAEAELELSFLRLQDQAVTRKLSAEEVRMRVSEWTRVNSAAFEKVEKERAATQPDAEVVEVTVPKADGKNADEFAEDVRLFKAGLVHNLTIQEAPGTESAERVRELVADRMAGEDIHQLDAQVAEAVESAAGDAPVVEEVPLSSKELNSLSRSERAAEDIFSAVYEATRRPLAKGEEVRDRIGHLDAWIAGKRKISEENVVEYRKEEVSARIQALQDLVNTPE